MNPLTATGRRVARHYPFLPFRGRLPLLNGREDAIPRGVVVSTREDLRVRVDRDGMYRDVYFWGDYEPYHTKVYRRIIRPGGVVLDVGTNFGWFAALFARWVGATGHVHAFEPVPSINALARETLELNGLSEQVTLNAFGLGAHGGALAIYTYAGLPHGHASAVDLGRDDAVRHECAVRRLDDYCEAAGVMSIQFMKVDVEGYEPEVFAGGERMLSASDAPIIGFEINGDVLRRRGLSGADAINPLRDFGYTEFFTLSTREGVQRIERFDVGSAECLAAKQARLAELAPALRAGRLLR